MLSEPIKDSSQSGDSRNFRTGKPGEPFSDLAYSLLTAGLSRQFRRLRKTLILCSATGLAGLVVIVALSRFSGLPIRAITDEAASVNKTQFYVGILSNLDGLMWAASGAICLFAAHFRRRAPNPAGSEFLFWSGVLSLFLRIDGVLLFHNRLLPQHLHIGERYFYVSFALLVGFYILYYARTIAATDYLLFAIAMAFLCTSAVAKAVLADQGIGIILQDGSKFVGVVFWLAYYVRASAEFMNAARGAV